jgi:hypothetical protein
VVYLNGVELLRDNMPDGLITASTPASGWKAGADETFVDYVVAPDALVAGRNVVAVEIHNVWRNNNDLSFDLSLAKSTEPVPQVDGPLVAPNAVWHYVDDATTAPAGWTAGLDGSPSGAGPLGFGENFLFTELAEGNSTYYFTRTFNVDDPAAISELVLSLMADDGAVVYVNQQEVHRFNLPVGTIDHTTQATTWVSGKAERNYVDTVIPGDVLVAGTNVVAVEIHNIWARNADLSFDLALDPITE